jgi:type VI secretion system protein ImpJ
MAADNKVIWSEGMFIRAQHFQQETRYLERLIRQRSDGVRPFAWGLADCQIDQGLLATGRFALVQGRGIFADGTPFQIPADDDHPTPLKLPEGTRDTVVYLTIPVRQSGGVECSSATDSETVARYRPFERDVQDSNEGGANIAAIQQGKLRLRYQLGTADLAGFLCLGLARIAEVRPDSSVMLDNRYIPTVMDCRAAPALTGFLNELTGLLHHRGEALGARVSGASRSVAEISDFMLLQVINRCEPLLAYFAQGAEIHPETVFQTFLSLAGELSTFTTANRRPPGLPLYRHDDLQSSFQPIMIALRTALSAVLEQAAMPIELVEHKYGIRVGTIPDRTLLGNAAFVLAVKAAMPTDRLSRTFPAQIKIGPVEHIRNLVNAALPGINLRPLPVAPRQIPYHTGVVYFELDRASPLWKQMESSGGLALHLAGDFPELELEFWAIKD